MPVVVVVLYHCYFVGVLVCDSVSLWFRLLCCLFVCLFVHVFVCGLYCLFGTCLDCLIVCLVVRLFHLPCARTCVWLYVCVFRCLSSD